MKTAAQEQFDRDYDGILARNGLPKAPGEILDMQYRTYTQDWWVKTKEGWFWLRGEDPRGGWKPSLYGPS